MAIETLRSRREDEVAMSQHRRSTSDRGGLATAATIGLSKLISAFIRRACGLSTSSRRVLQKIPHIVAGAERISRAVPEYDPNLIVLCGGIEQVRQGDVHGRCHRVLRRRPI